MEKTADETKSVFWKGIEKIIENNAVVDFVHWAYLCGVMDEEKRLFSNNAESFNRIWAEATPSQIAQAIEGGNYWPDEPYFQVRGGNIYTLDKFDVTLMLWEMRENLKTFYFANKESINNMMCIKNRKKEG